MQYNEEAAKKIYEACLKYAGKQKEFSYEEHHIIMGRRIACNLLVEKIERFLDNLKVKGYKVTLQEYSNANPHLSISLPYKSKDNYIIYDRRGIYFDRDHYLFQDDLRLNMPNARMWLPYEWWNYCSGCHKKNREIFDKLEKEFPLERIGILLNYPFISCWDEEEGYLLLADCKNIT